MSAPESDHRSGESIAHFVIVEEIGRGGMGVVYRATDDKLRRTVALKVLPQELTDDEERRERFLREARAAAAVDHPNIATIFEVGECQGEVFIAMEFVRGESLRQRLGRGLGLADAVGLAAEIARGLAKAHRADVIHRDLKPDNVMVDDEGHARLLDFGLAKLREPDELADADAVDATEVEEAATATAMLTEEGRVLGTPGYMSPEQAKGRPLDPRSDIFSLGAMLYEMVTGVRPFVGNSLMEVVAATMRDEPGQPSEQNPEVGPTLDQLITRCLAKDPAERYQSAAEVAEALEALGRAEAASVASTGPQPLSTPASDRRPRSVYQSAPRWLWGLAALAIGAGFMLCDRVRSPQTERTVPDRAASSAAPLASAPAGGDDDPAWIPRPQSTSAEALEAFRQGMRASRDGLQAPAHFERALELDPDFAPARLRVAMWSYYATQPTSARKHFELTSQHKSRLSEAERLWLDALEPLLRRHPADHTESGKRFDRALERFPKQPELLMHAAIVHEREDPQKALALLDRALAVDPGFTFALYVKAETQAYLGQFDAAKRSIEACLKRPSVICRMTAIALMKQQGDCQGIEDQARQIIATEPSSPIGHRTLAGALASQGKRPEAIFAADEQASKRVAGSGEWIEKPAKLYEQKMVLAVSALWGDFVRAEKAAKLWQEAIVDEPSRPSHAGPAANLAALAVETGRLDAAADIAEAFLAKRSAWEPNPRVEDYAVVTDPVPGLLSILRRADRISHDELAERLAGWIKEWDERGLAAPYRGYLWPAGYARVAHSAEEAELALAKRSDFEPLPAFFPLGMPELHIGRTYLLAGKLDEAVVWLERAVASCRALNAAFGHNRARYWLGRAREEKGDKKAACQAYGAVLVHWGEAKPRSVTVEQTRERMSKLGCPAGK